MKPETWFGYKVENSEKPLQSPKEYFDLIYKPPLCMVQSVDLDLLIDLNKDGNALGFKVGQYVLSSGDCETDIFILGPFDDLQSAFEAAKAKLGVNKFIEPLGPI